MNITIIQHDIAWAKPAENRAHLSEVIDTTEPTDLIVLPEMFSTGFATEPKGIAESDGRSLAWMKGAAAARGCAVAGSVATVEDGDYFNRFYFVHPSGEVAWYDKRHLFTYGGEHRHFTAGQEAVMVEYRGARIRLFVCYDLRFPVWSRNSGEEPYDIALYVASWPTSRIEAWDTLLKARAIENQCYVVGVNRIGTDPACTYCGSSAIINPYGQVAASCGRGVAAAITTEIDIDALKAFREKFPVLNDADRYYLKHFL